MGINEFMGELERSLKPYKDDFATLSRIPEVGRDKEEILKVMETFKSIEESSCSCFL